MTLGEFLYPKKILIFDVTQSRYHSRVWKRL